MRRVTLDGKTYRLADLVKLSKEQQAAQRRASQLTLFELKDDTRPPTQRNASARFQEPTLF